MSTITEILSSDNPAASVSVLNANFDSLNTTKQEKPAEGAFADGDKTKLNGIETGADVTDTANVTAAGALMDSEVTNLAQVKAFSSADYATAAQGATADGALSRGGGTMTGNITLGENTSLDLDPAGSADGKYSGICITGTAGATLAFGDLIYLAVADSRWELTDADATATAGTPLIGMCVLAAAADGSATKILLQGTIRADAKFPTLTIGAPAYVGETAGAIQTAIPTESRQCYSHCWAGTYC
jgi:hypothetical protein